MRIKQDLFSSSGEVCASKIKSRLKCFVLGFALILGCSSVAFAQTKILVAGKVTNENGETMPGVTVFYKVDSVAVANSENVTMTSVTGDYTILAGKTGFLQFSFIGYQTQKVNVGKGSVFNVVMKPDVEDIDEVVVTGIFTRKTESYTGASNKVTADQLQSFGNRNVLQTIRNLEPSFNVIDNNLLGSDPNQTTTVQIRGVSTLPNTSDLKDEASASLNSPLVILDGFESTMTILQDMNENEIESITILKDASATAIYGSRGANGVVVITTKQPKAGKLRVSWRSDLNIEAPDLTQYDLLNAREKLELERITNKYNSNNIETDLALKEYYNTVLNEVNRGVDTYWLSKPLRVGVGQKHSLMLDGGDSQFRYAATLQYNDIEGVMKGSSRETVNGGIKLIYRHKNVSFQNNLMINVLQTENSPYGSFSDYVKLNPYWRETDENGNTLKQFGIYNGTSAAPRWTSAPINPMYNATLNTFDISEKTTITNNTSLEWDILKSLKMRAQLGIVKSSNTSDNYKPAEHTDFANKTGEDFFDRGSYAYGSGSAFSYDASVNLSYNKVINTKHLIFAGLNYNVLERRNENYGFKAIGFTNQNIDFLGAALKYEENGSPSGNESVSRAIGFTSNVNYMYDQRYLFDFSFRADGSSQFGSNDRFAPFWSLGLGWNMHEEQFLKDSAVSRLKLRGSIGTSGSQNFDPYQALATYKYYTNDRYYGWNGATLMALGNDDLRWQQQISRNLGVDLGLFDDRIISSFDYYTNKTNGMISSVDLPASSGFDSYVANIGEVQNKGVEFNVTGYLIRNRETGLSWTLSLSGMHNKNEITELSPAMKQVQEQMLVDQDDDNNGQDKDKVAAKVDPNRMYVEGHSVDAIWVVQSLGIDPSNGKEIYVKRNGEKTYVWDSADLIDAGGKDPKLQGNINSSLRYKSLSVSASLGYRLGAMMYNSTLINKVENADYNYNVDQRVYEDRWQKPGDDAAFKALLNTTTTYKSTRFVQKENMLSLQNVNIRYDLKPVVSFLREKSIQSFVVTANASNLFYLSTIKQERGTTYPFARNFTLGLDVIF